MPHVLLWCAVHLLRKRHHLYTGSARSIFNGVQRDSENAGLMAELNEQNRSSSDPDRLLLILMNYSVQITA